VTPTASCADKSTVTAVVFVHTAPLLMLIEPLSGAVVSWTVTSNEPLSERPPLSATEQSTCVVPMANRLPDDGLHETLAVRSPSS
jgi:hypothetical protein